MATDPSGPLAGRRVLELADEQGVYCGKLLADLGADVIKIEPPAGDPTRRIPPLTDAGGESLYFLYMNTSKRGVTLNLESGAGRELFARLAAGADLVVETLPPGTLSSMGCSRNRPRSDQPSCSGIMTSSTMICGLASTTQSSPDCAPCVPTKRYRLPDK